jgi:hypothetical protein
MEFTMTEPNDTESKLYNQLMIVKRCSNALKDIYLNIPEDDTYVSALSIIGDRLEQEIDNLHVLTLTSYRDASS